MSQITGWVLVDGGPENAERVLASMLDAVQPPGEHRPPGAHQTALSGRLGLGVDDVDCLHIGDACLAAWTGHPRWHNRRSASETGGLGFGATLASAWAESGPRLLDDLHGRFSLVVLDKSDGTAHLVIDRFGVERLAFARVTGGFLFGTSLDAFRAFPGFEAHLDPQAVFNYLYFHVVPSPRSIYRGAQKLQPGERAALGCGKAEVRRGQPVTFGDALDSAAELEATLVTRLQISVENAIRRRPVAAFLSGGLDSSTVVGMASRVAPGQVTAFCVGFDAEGYDETPFARESAAHFNVPLVERYVTPDDVRRAIKLVAVAYDEPFGNASAVPAFYCAARARSDGFDLILAGDGGDELFAGNERYARQTLFEAYARLPSWLRTTAIEAVFELIGERGGTLLRKARSYVDQARIPLPERLETYNPLHRFALKDVLTQELLRQVDSEEPLALLRQPYFAADGADTLKRMLHLDMKLTLADNDIRKVSRMCEWAGIGVAYPMLDEALVDFAAWVPSRLLLQGRELRAFYKRALRGFLPPHTLTKSKHGFGLPFGVWLTSDPELRRFAQESLQRLVSGGVIQAPFVDNLLDKHASEHASYYGVMVWVLLALESWLAERRIRMP